MDGNANRLYGELRPGEMSLAARQRGRPAAIEVEQVNTTKETEIEVPRARSRVGDFAFVAAAGIIAIVSASTIGAHSFAALAIVVAGFALALALRYLLLKDAPAVRAGLDVSEEQLATLRRLRAVLNALPQPVMLLNDAEIVEMFNPACAAAFGADIGGRHISSVVRAPGALEVLRAVQKTGAPAEAEYVMPGPPERHTLFYGAPLEAGRGGGESGIIVMIRDRTEQKKLERTRTDFIANASHELRTPLTSMIGFIETLQGHARDDVAARDRFLTLMFGQAERMLRLVEDLVGLSTIELNEAKPPADTIDLKTIAGSVCETLQPLVRKAGATLTFAPLAPELLIVGDRHEVFRMLQNLCDNAIKYGVPKAGGGATVTLSVGRGLPPFWDGAMRTGDAPRLVAARAGAADENLVWARVEDAGDGIDQNDLPRLTERFYRVNPQLSRAKGGTGLGLAIVKHILQRHRGALTIESRPGQGAAFCVILPPAGASGLASARRGDTGKRTERA